MKKTQDLFIENLTELRRRAGMTQADLAKFVNLSLRGYQKYEQAEAWPKPTVIDKISVALKSPVSSFFKGDAQAVERPAIDKSVLAAIQDATEKAIKSNLHTFDLSEDEKKIILGLRRKPTWVSRVLRFLDDEPKVTTSTKISG